MPEHDHRDEDRLRMESLLVDLHLDRIDEADRREVESRLASDPALGALSDRIGRTLQPLDHWSAAPMPDGLFDRVMERISARTETGKPVDDEPPVDRPRFGGWRWREMFAVAACIGILAMAVVPGLSQLRQRSRMAVCRANLSTIFQGAKLYQASFAGALPFAGSSPSASWLPTSPERHFASNSRHMYLLAKQNFGPTTGDFVCPSRADSTPMDPNELADHNDFVRASNVGYDSLNLSGTSPNLRPSAAIAYAGDANPLFRSGSFDDSIDASRANSRAHRGAGQNVVALDGSVKWLTTPIYGRKSDNIWLAGNIRHYEGTEHPTNGDDAHLVPGYPSTDPQVRSLMAP